MSFFTMTINKANAANDVFPLKLEQNSRIFNFAPSAETRLKHGFVRGGAGKSLLDTAQIEYDPTFDGVLST